MKQHTPIQWGAHEPGRLEMTMAVLLHQSRPRSRHRTPSQGDGGVDVYEPVADGQFDIFQIKGFVGRLSEGTRKKQIADSLKAAIADPRLPGGVREWNLVLPIDFTSGEEDWFRELTESAPFRCDWRGEAFWHSESSKFPYVVDYYLHDRRAEVERDLAEALRFAREDLDTSIKPVEALSRMQELSEVVNRTSPHYRLDFHITSELPVPPRVEGLVLSYAQGPADGGPYGSVDVIARFPQATELEPVTGTVQFDPAAVAETHPDFHAALEDWVEYGSELHIPAGAATFTMSGPAGIGSESEATSAGGWIGTPELAHKTRLRLRITSPDDNQVELPVHVTKGSTGFTGSQEFHVEDGEQLMKVRVRLRAASRSGSIDVSTAETDLAGYPVARLHPVTSFLAAFVEGSTLHVLPEFGTDKLISAPLDGSFGLEDQVVELVDLLHRLQPYAARPILYPKGMDPETWRDLQHADQLFTDGERWGTWSGINLNFNGEVDEAQLADLRSPKHLVQTGRLEIDLDDQHLDFGPTYIIFYAAVLAEISDDSSSGRLVPEADDRYVERIGQLTTAVPAPPPVPLPSS